MQRPPRKRTTLLLPVSLRDDTASPFLSLGVDTAALFAVFAPLLPLFRPPARVNEGSLDGFSTFKHTFSS